MTIVQLAAQWRAVPGFERKYEMSDQGDILSLLNGRHILRPGKRPAGYMVTLRKNSRAYMFPMHRLMLLTFRPLPRGANPRHYVAKPVNNNIYDIRLENWEWVKKPSPRARLTEDDVRAIRTQVLTDATLPYRVIAQEYGVALSTIAHIMTGRNWGHLK